MHQTVLKLMFKQFHDRYGDFSSFHWKKNICNVILISNFWLANLKELTSNESFYYENGKLIAMTSVDIVATVLVNLERVHLKETVLWDILSFAHNSIRLKKMKVDFISVKKDFKCTLDWPVINKKRKKLFEARKLTIYVEEQVYLSTKRTHYKTDLDLIEMRRTESSQWWDCLF